VVQRPERVVGEALVVALDLEHAQHHWNDVDAVDVEGLQFEVRLAAPADPGAFVLLHDGLESGDQSPGGAVPASFAIDADNTIDREAIGHDDEAVGAAFRKSHCNAKFTAPRPTSIARW
jgi:hypothetical protein